MAITIPQDAVKTSKKLWVHWVEKIILTISLMLRMSMRNPEQRKLLKMVVYVPQAKRVTAAANIQASLDGDGVIAEVLAKKLN